MMLLWLILVPVIGALIAAASERLSQQAPRWVSLAALAVELALAITLALGAPGSAGVPAGWLAQLDWPWIPQLGITFRLDLDGLSLILILLTVGLTVLAVAASWKEIRTRTGQFHLCLLLTAAGTIGVFLALDLFLLFFFWELMLVPMYFIIAVWGHERRVYAAYKFFLFTQGSGLAMLVAILALAFAHRHATGVLTFDYFTLLGTPLSGTAAFWIMLGFFIAFAVKLPSVPFHSWLPDAHTEAPTAGSVILAGVMLKTGAYGLMRFVVPLFPGAAHGFAPVAMLLGTISILYGALLAFAQRDLKRLVAFSSVSHMGFVMLGVFAFTALSLQGAVVVIVAHGITTSALFVLVGMLQERLHTRDMRRMGGLASDLPRLSALTMLFAIATLGLPGMGNFIGEFLVLLGSYPVNEYLTMTAAVGIVTAVMYALLMIQRALHGREREPRHAQDLGAREMLILGIFTAAIVWLGVFPQPLFDRATSAIEHLQMPRATVPPPQGVVPPARPRP